MIMFFQLIQLLIILLFKINTNCIHCIQFSVLKILYPVYYSNFCIQILVLKNSDSEFCIQTFGTQNLVSHFYYSNALNLDLNKFIGKTFILKVDVFNVVVLKLIIFKVIDLKVLIINSIIQSCI